MAAMYAVYHGPEGLKRIATRVNGLTNTFAKCVEESGLKLRNPIGSFFDTVAFKCSTPKVYTL